MKILVVEDDRAVADTLQLLFSSYNYAVDIAADGAAGLEMAEAFEYDLILLDILLPKLDGISLCQYLRSKGFQSPILLLTGQGEGQQKAIALNTGADDYVVKPFDAAELIARVQALLRRGRSTSQPILAWGHLSLDPNSRKVTYGTHLLTVTPKEYAILELFLRHPQTVFSARAILDHGWAATESPGEEAVRVHIKELRQKFKAVDAPKDLIKTVYRVGYRLNPLYSSFLATQSEQQLAAPQVAELKSVNEELRVALEQLRSTQAELSQKNQELEIAYQTIEQERQQLQTARDELEQRVAERTTELINANQFAQRQESQWQALFEHALDAIIIADDEGRYVDANPAACQLFGVSREDLLHSTVTDFTAPEVDTTQVWRQLLQQGQMTGEFCLHRPDGTTRETEFNTIANFIPGRHLSVLRDISDRKLGEAERQQTETALRKSERRLSVLMNNLPGYVYRVANDPNYTAEFISEGVFRITGYRQEDYLSKRTISCGQEIHPDDADRVWNLVQQAVAAHQPYECEYRIITQEGSQKWVWERGQGIYEADGTLSFLEGFVTDFTDRKHTEEALRESEQQYRQILDSIADMVIVKQPGSRLVWANKAFRDYYGMTLEELQGIIDAPFNEPDYTLQYVQDDAWVFATGQTLKIPEEPITGHDGVVRLFSTIKAPIYDESGQIAMLVAVCRDITDQKQAEVKLRQRKDFLDSIYEGADQAVFVIDVDAANNFRYISFNPIAEQFAGASAQELQGKTPEEAFGSVIGASFRQNYSRCLQAGTSISYEEYVVFENHTLWSLTTLSPLRNEQGDIYRLVGSAIDITDRKQLELSLQASEAKLSQILDNAIAAIVSLRVFSNRDWEYDYFSNGCELLFGYTAQELIADKTLWMSQILPEDRETVILPLYEQFFAASSSVVEYRFHHKNGSIRWISSTYASQQIADNCWQITIVNQDITDRKHAELTLQQQFLREQLIAEISRDIRRSLDLNDVLFQTVERVRELLGTDRVIIFRFRSDWQGDVIMESVGANWISLLSTTIADPCFRDRYTEPYRLGRIGILHDLDQADLAPCYIELLKQFQVKANLIAPILQGENLWGLLTVQHCSAPRQWHPSEIDLLRQLATQVGIAIQQSELYQQTRLDLLERERMQTVLEESEERFRTLSSAAPVGICQTNADGICIYTNARWQEMSGLSFADCLGDGWLQAVHPDDRPMLSAAWEAFIQGGSECIPDFRLLTPQGEIRWISAKVATMQSATGEIIGYVGIDEDVTDRKLAEQKIQEQAALLDIASDAIFVRDLEHQILYWNQGAERLYGWNATEAIGQKAINLLQEPTAQIPQIMRALLDRGEWQGEIHKTTKAGKETIVETHWTLVRDELGQPRSILCVSTDITEKKQIEAQFYQAQRLESLGTLASGIAHDLNNVLTPILAIAQLLRLKPLNLDERSQEMLRILEDSAKRGANMIKQILTFTRGTGEKRISLQVAPLLLEVAHVAQQTFPKSIAIRENIPDQFCGLVSADPTHLYQVFMNLCVNARDAMPSGGILTFSLENCFVDAAFAQMNLNAQVGNYIVVTIADTGTGISAELCDRIFEPFFTTKEPSKGTGLGLSTVLGIVRDYGGFVQVSSEVGQGSQFKVYLPTIEGATEERAQLEAVLHGNGELVLIVDDDLAVQQANQSLLEHHHYKTLVANDGIEATALYVKHQDDIQVVLIDVMMPHMDGVTTVRILQKINPQVKIIAISGLASNREPILSAGAKAFLLKPYSLEDLLRSLHDLIE